MSCSKTTYSNRTGVYKSVTYTFTDSSGTSQSVKYTTEGSKYYISAMLLSTNKTVHEELSIGVTASLRSYNMTIQ
jgi:hypothetical protein